MHQNQDKAFSNTNINRDIGEYVKLQSNIYIYKEFVLKELLHNLIQINKVGETNGKNFNYRWCMCW